MPSTTTAGGRPTGGPPPAGHPGEPDRTVDTVVIGGGQAGLALSATLRPRGVPHVVLERGQVAQRWRDRWDSLTLLSPNWSNRLPGRAARPRDPDGFLHREELVADLACYAVEIGAPVVEHVAVEGVVPGDDGWIVRTTRGTWRARSVAVATGHCDLPRIPGLAASLGTAIRQLHSSEYRNPAAIPGDGPVLVVGAGASGQQIALELAEAGRAVTLAVGRHSRVPRTYRGRDVYWWYAQVGVFAQDTTSVSDLEAARRSPSLVLCGRDGGRTIDLDVLEAAGVRLAGHLRAIEQRTSGPVARFAADLVPTRAEADDGARRWLGRFDAWAADQGLDLPDDPSAHPPIRRDHRTGMSELPLAAPPTTVIWATGYRRDFSWIDADVFDAEGEPVHHRGVTDAAGLYFLGLRWQHTRASSFIGGVGADADHLATAIARRRRRAAARRAAA
jgi:putative flavoprotein involved in K+ transport